MDDLKRMAVFAAVVQHGSMSGAARALGMSTSAVSQQVRKLESDGGVTLLHRSTRKLALTDAGQRYHAGCAAMCAAAEQARAELAASRDAPSGELRLSATVGFARHVAPALGALLAEHPALRLRLLVDDAPIDLINTRIDLAVRFGRLQDTLGDKLIPALLLREQEALGSALDNLDRAERLGWLDSAEDWVDARRLRNGFVHEYVRDAAVLAANLMQGHARVPMLTACAERLVQHSRARGWV